MGKLRKEDAAGSGGGLIAQSKAVGRKRDLRWKMIYIVTAMGFIGLSQLVVVEHRRHWSRSSRQEGPFSSHRAGDLGTTTPTSARRSTSSQHGVLPNASSDDQFAVQSKSEPPCKTDDCASNNNDDDDDDPSTDNRHELPIKKPADEIPTRKNTKLLKFTTSNTFLPMKDETRPGMSDTDTNWFMSGLHGTTTTAGETFDLPRDDPEGRVLCVHGHDQNDGTKNSYGLFETLPADAHFLHGTTLIADNYWDYHNPWHAMSALANFATWRLEGRCAKADRLVLYHMGELMVSMGDWITHVLQAAFMKPIPLETLTLNLSRGEDVRSGATCFERAVVQRRGLGGLDKAHINAVFDMLRCKARRYCGVSEQQKRSWPEVLLFTRSGPRAFANESGVAAVVRKECDEVPGCNLRVVNAAKLSFCEQVQVLTSTDVLISVHGAQLTNMMFMSPGSHVMELFPKGWLEFAGVGQEIYKWHADWTRVIHAGRWRDPEGPDCPFPASETLKCLFFFKDREVGLNATHLALWTKEVLGQYYSPGDRHDREDPRDQGTGYNSSSSCACDETDQSSLGASFATTNSKLLLQQ